MSRFYLKLWLITHTDDHDEQNVAFDRIRYFIDSVISNTVFVDEDQVEVCRKLTESGLSVTTVPSVPVDQIIGILLHTKLNAICESRFTVIDTEISSDAGDRVWFLHGEEEDNPFDSLPGWWNEPDLSHYNGDIVSARGKVVNLSKIKKWREVHLNWPEEGDSIVFEPTSNTVIFGDFNSEPR
jgi:hypothetical protein